MKAKTILNERGLVHGRNLKQKENHKTKYLDEESKEFLTEIREKYDEWKEANIELAGPFKKFDKEDEATIEERVKLLNEYKDFIDQQKYAEKFDSRSNLHSSVLEEFIYFLFEDLVAQYSEDALIGKARAFKDLFFMPPNFSEMVDFPHAKLELKDHDFVIGSSITSKMYCGEKESNIEEHQFQIPAVAIECKTYLDKTMLEGSSTAAEQLKARNPNAIYIVVAEWLKLTSDVNLHKFQVDQIYVLRKQKNTDREFRYADDYDKNPIYSDVVCHIYNKVHSHLTRDWEGGVQFGLDKGYLM